MWRWRATRGAPCVSSSCCGATGVPTTHWTSQTACAWLMSHLRLLLRVHAHRLRAHVALSFTTHAALRARPRAVDCAITLCAVAAGGMGDDAMMAAVADGVGARTVPPGLVRRRRKTPPVLSQQQQHSTAGMGGLGMG